MPSHEELSPATTAVTAGRPPRIQGGPVNPPVVLSSTYVSQGVPGPELLYTRGGTETWVPFEEALGRLEGAAHPAIVFGSGMAAVAAALSLVPDHGVLVVPRHAYQVSLGFADDLAARHGVEVRRVDIAETDQVVAALDGADVALLESPTNPMLEVADLPALLAAARERGVRTVVDNTFATPLLQNPLAPGADVVL
ncbi:MAG: PLP-dependent transferase, partial [Promicromonosporaceae bacterium]|nr:PLP-dependent transferase [Promicromonosporaceae bacterium]